MALTGVYKMDSRGKVSFFACDQGIFSLDLKNEEIRWIHGPVATPGRPRMGFCND